MIPANSEMPDGAVITGPKDLNKLQPRSTDDQNETPEALPKTGSGGLSIGRAAALGAAGAHYAVPEPSTRTLLQVGNRNR